MKKHYFFLIAIFVLNCNNNSTNQKKFMQKRQDIIIEKKINNKKHKISKKVRFRDFDFWRMGGINQIKENEELYPCIEVEKAVNSINVKIFFDEENEKSPLIYTFLKENNYYKLNVVSKDNCINCNPYEERYCYFFFKDFILKYSTGVDLAMVDKGYLIKNIQKLNKNKRKVISFLGKDESNLEFRRTKQNPFLDFETLYYEHQGHKNEITYSIKNNCLLWIDMHFYKNEIKDNFEELICFDTDTLSISLARKEGVSYFFDIFLR
jgi:hypothetical protein